MIVKKQSVISNCLLSVLKAKFRLRKYKTHILFTDLHFWLYVHLDKDYYFEFVDVRAIRKLHRTHPYLYFILCIIPYRGYDVLGVL